MANLPTCTCASVILRTFSQTLCTYQLKSLQHLKSNNHSKKVICRSLVWTKIFARLTHIFGMELRLALPTWESHSPPRSTPGRESWLVAWWRSSETARPHEPGCLPLLPPHWLLSPAMSEWHHTQSICVRSSEGFEPLELPCYPDRWTPLSVCVCVCVCVCVREREREREMVT